MTFDDFTITPANRIAHAAARAVAEAPTKAYNPIWIYGMGSQPSQLVETLRRALSTSGAPFHVLDGCEQVTCDVDALVDEGVQVIVTSQDKPGDYPFLSSDMALCTQIP